MHIQSRVILREPEVADRPLFPIHWRPRAPIPLSRQLTRRYAPLQDHANADSPSTRTHWRNASMPMRPSGPQGEADPPIVTAIVEFAPPRSSLTLGAFPSVCASAPTPCVRPLSDARSASAPAIREPVAASVLVAPVSTSSVPPIPSAVAEAAYCLFSNGDCAFRHTWVPPEINGRLRPNLATALSKDSNRSVGPRRSSTELRVPWQSVVAK